MITEAKGRSNNVRPFFSFLTLYLVHPGDEVRGSGKNSSEAAFAIILKGRPSRRLPRFVATYLPTIVRMKPSRAWTRVVNRDTAQISAALGKWMLLKWRKSASSSWHDGFSFPFVLNRSLSRFERTATSSIAQLAP